MINSDIVNPVNIHNIYLYIYRTEPAAHSSHKLMIASFDHAAATQERVCMHACDSVCTDGVYSIRVCKLVP